MFKSTNRKPRKSRKHTNPVQMCEPLENRLMFVTYQVTGTGGNDAISISISGNSIISAVNGVSDSASDIINNNIEISGLGGADTITIVETGSNTVVVNAGGGDDTINIALGANDLDAIDDNVTVNGESGNDTVALFDNSQSTSVGFGLTGGNQIGRTNMPTLTANVESVEIEGGSSLDTFSIGDAPTFNLHIEGNGSTGDILNLVGAAGEAAVYLPSGAANNSGAVSFVGQSSMTFLTIENVNTQGYSDFTLETPHANDILTVTDGDTLTGTTGGVAFAPLSFTNIGTLTLDLGQNDSGAGNDTLTMFGTTSQAAVIKINAGTGTNTLTNFGNFTIDTGAGPNFGNNLTVIDNGGALTFDGTQTLNRLEVNSGGVIRFNGFGTLLSTQALAVVTGTGTFDMASNQSATVPPSGTFTIGAGRTLIKKGLGGMSCVGTQSHGTGATLKVENGTYNLNSDAGTAAVHPLNLWAAGGELNIGSTQHVSSVVADVGFVRMLTNGSRVLVTDAVATGSEGGVIDLRDNDMILNYTNAADDTAARAILHSGRANGGWNGLGINSSTAAANAGHITTLGAMEATEFKAFYGGAATFDGQTIDNTCLLIKYTYYGDTDFNGKVDGADYARIDATFNLETTQGNIGGWTKGDLDDNGKVDGADYALIDAAFNGQGAILRPGANPSVLPTVGKPSSGAAWRS